MGRSREGEELDGVELGKYNTVPSSTLRNQNAPAYFPLDKISREELLLAAWLLHPRVTKENKGGVLSFAVNDEPVADGIDDPFVDSGVSVVAVHVYDATVAAETYY